MKKLLFLSVIIIILHFFLPFKFLLNGTESLPGYLFILHKNYLPKSIDDKAFFNKENSFYPDKVFLKKVAGFAGDTIVIIDRNIWVYSSKENRYIYVGYAKEQTKLGEKLEIISDSPLVLQDKQYYVYTPHPDSLDSRYKAIGLVEQKQILGTAFAFPYLSILQLILVVSLMLVGFINKANQKSLLSKLRVTAMATSLILFSAFTTQAKDLGVRGEIFKIEEDDMRKAIDYRLKKMESSGELAELHEKWKEDTKKKIHRPNEVQGIGKTKEVREYIHPHLIVQEDIKDFKGRIIAKKGTVVNPFDHVNMKEELLFIDGDDEEQIQWALDIYSNKPAVIILVKGSVIKLMKDNNVRLYFDQSGFLVKKLGIKNVPARVFQDGKDLKIREEVIY